MSQNDGPTPLSNYSPPLLPDPAVRPREQRQPSHACRRLPSGRWRHSLYSLSPHLEEAVQEGHSNSGQRLHIHSFLKLCAPVLWSARIQISSLASSSIASATDIFLICGDHHSESEHCGSERTHPLTLESSPSALGEGSSEASKGADEYWMRKS